MTTYKNIIITKEEINSECKTIRNTLKYGETKFFLYKSFIFYKNSNLMTSALRVEFDMDETENIETIVSEMHDSDLPIYHIFSHPIIYNQFIDYLKDMNTKKDGTLLLLNYHNRQDGCLFGFKVSKPKKQIYSNIRPIKGTRFTRSVILENNIRQTELKPIYSSSKPIKGFTRSIFASGKRGRKTIKNKKEKKKNSKKKTRNRFKVSKK